MFTISDSAANRIQGLAKEELESSIFRVSVIGGGCSGFQYKFAFVPRSSITADDRVFSNNGSEVVVDTVSQQFLENAVLEFRESLKGSEFEIVNPEATSKCGCGSSFSI